MTHKANIKKSYSNDHCQINLINGDSMEALKKMEENQYDLAIVDDQTGQDEGNKNPTRPAAVRQKNGSNINVPKRTLKSDWDKSVPTQEYFDNLFKACKYHILMCEPQLNFDQKTTSPGRIIWNLLRNNDFGDCQIMWTNLFKTIDYFEYMWNGMIQGTAINSRRQIGDKTKNEKRIHDSQKPIIVYKHLLCEYAKTGWKILDTKGGSMSHAIACWDLGYSLDLFEIDTNIFKAGVKRFEEHISKPQLFEPKEMYSKQLKI